MSAIKKSILFGLIFLMDFLWVAKCQLYNPKVKTEVNYCFRDQTPSTTTINNGSLHETYPPKGGSIKAVEGACCRQWLVLKYGQVQAGSSMMAQFKYNPDLIFFKNALSQFSESLHVVEVRGVWEHLRTSSPGAGNKRIPFLKRI